MSAFNVSVKHIDTLVGLGQLHLRIFGKEANDVGTELIRQNAKSVAARYREEPTSTGEGYEFQMTSAILNMKPVAGLKAIACYEYQACEDEGWERSQARKFCETLKATLIHALPGYSEADWEVR